MAELTIKDSQYIPGKSTVPHICGSISLLICAIDKLNSEKDSLQFVPLSKLSIKREKPDKILWYEINFDGLRKIYSSFSFKKATFYSSHYIGFYSTFYDKEQVDIKIEPRFGNTTNVFNYLLSYASGFYLPKDSFSQYEKNQKNNYWLMALLWKASLDKALSKSHISKEYKKEEKNIGFFKGRLKLSKHIKYNLVDKSRFYCQYRKMTLNTTINRTIKYIYKILKNKNCGSLLLNIAEYESKLTSFGVQDEKVTINDINKINYSKLNIHYKPVMELSKSIIKNKLASSSSTGQTKDSFGYFIDMAELWELYLLKLLQRNLPKYNVYSPNIKGSQYLIENEYRQIRPDIIIEKDNKIVAILDAKYKFYNKLGANGTHPNVSREDLYQMTSYLYHYGKENKKIKGLFITPVAITEDSEKKNICKYSNNENHKIGVLGLNLGVDKYNNSENQKEKSFNEKIKEEENSFIKKLKNSLKSD